MDKIPEGVALVVVLVVDFFTVEITALDVVDEVVLIGFAFVEVTLNELEFVFRLVVLAEAAVAGVANCFLDRSSVVIIRETRCTVCRAHKAISFT